ncbi:hypothetical protein FIBSPDRAFT_1038022 [Athelia psychrophila]|uniref:Uncharacterized protein n=1 Tax=Athelia psychrophila TaxID=1759441 RepID=A0A166TM72_9AGAM|nr:hypothetical protein FIBSPDRAFT_1038022 [Fibularhizoctonia sp. CBS 109695]
MSYYGAPKYDGQAQYASPPQAPQGYSGGGYGASPPQQYGGLGGGYGSPQSAYGGGQGYGGGFGGGASNPYGGRYIPVRQAPKQGLISGLLGNGGPTPPPADQSLGRPAPPNLPYPPFPPTYIIGGKSLDGGFPVELPPAMTEPHPFILHDVTRGDWDRFVTDVTNAGSLSGRQQIGKQAIGLVMPGLGGMVVGAIVKKGMQAGKIGPTAQLVDQWNRDFFHPRRMEVILSSAGQRLDSGSGPVPPIEYEIEKLSAARSRSAEKDFEKDQRKNKKGKKGGDDRGRGRQMVPDDGLCRLFVVGF